MAPEQTFWNGEPCVARKVALVVAEDPSRKWLWSNVHAGTQRNAVEVRYGESVFYLDDDALPHPERDAARREFGVSLPGSPAGQGWAKVTRGMGSPRYGHRELTPVEGSVQDRG